MGEGLGMRIVENGRGPGSEDSRELSYAIFGTCTLVHVTVFVVTRVR